MVLFGYTLFAGEFGKEILWLQTLRSWKIWTWQKSMLEGSMQKSLKRPKGVNDCIPNRSWNSKIVWKSTRSPRIHSKAETTCREWRPFREVRRSLNNLTKQKMTQKPAMIFGQSKEISFVVIMSNLEFNSVCRKKKHALVHWKIWTCDQDYAHKFGRVSRDPYKTHWRSSTLCRKVWWLDNGRSQGPPWGGWITLSLFKVLAHKWIQIYPFKNKGFTGNGKEFTKVLRVVAKNKYFNGQFIGICKILWSTCVKWKCGKASTERRVSFRNTGMDARIHRESCGWQSSWTQRLTREFFSWIIFRASEKCGFG